MDAPIQEAIQAAKKKSQTATPASLGHLLQDSTFLNKIQGSVNGWIREIQKVTSLSRDIASGTLTQEINFWINLENTLLKTEEELQSDGITLTLDVLKFAKRYHATVSFLADTGLKETLEKVQKYNLIMRVCH